MSFELDEGAEAHRATDRRLLRACSAEEVRRTTSWHNGGLVLLTAAGRMQQLISPDAGSDAAPLTRRHSFARGGTLGGTQEVGRAGPDST